MSHAFAEAIAAASSALVAVMTSLQVDRQALNFGFRLEEVEIDGVAAWQWQRGQRHSPLFSNEGCGPVLDE